MNRDIIPLLSSINWHFHVFWAAQNQDAWRESRYLASKCPSNAWNSGVEREKKSPKQWWPVVDTLPSIRNGLYVDIKIELIRIAIYSNHKVYIYIHVCVYVYVMHPNLPAKDWSVRVSIVSRRGAWRRPTSCFEEPPGDVSYPPSNIQTSIYKRYIYK